MHYRPIHNVLHWDQGRLASMMHQVCSHHLRVCRIHLPILLLTHSTHICQASWCHISIDSDSITWQDFKMLPNYQALFRGCQVHFFLSDVRLSTQNTMDNHTPLSHRQDLSPASLFSIHHDGWHILCFNGVCDGCTCRWNWHATSPTNSQCVFSADQLLQWE